MLPPPETIRESESKARPLPVEPWVAANLSRVWQSMKTHIQQTTVSGLATVSNASDTQAQPHSAQSTPASARSRS
jgi:hypothetical protein